MKCKGATFWYITIRKITMQTQFHMQKLSLVNLTPKTPIPALEISFSKLFSEVVLNDASDYPA
jgi:hypothetical protein